MVSRMSPSEFFSASEPPVIQEKKEPIVSAVNSNNNTILLPQNSTISINDNKGLMLFLGIGLAAVILYFLMKKDASV